MKRRKASLLVLLITLVLFMMNTPVFADENAPVSDLFKQNEQQEPDTLHSNTETDNPSFGSLLLKTVVILALIIFMIYGLSKWIMKRNQSFTKSQLMSVKAGLSLGQNKSVRLIKVGSAFYLLGVGNDVQLLKEFTEAESQELEDIGQDASNFESNSSKRLWHEFRAVFQRKKTEDDGSFEKQLEERLMQLKDDRNEQAPYNVDQREQKRGELNQ